MAAGNEEPVADVTVTARGGDGLTALPLSTRTATDGTFRLDALATGNYEVVATAARWRSDRRRVALETGDVAGPVVLTAVPASALSGVVSVSGQPCLEGYVDPRRVVEGRELPVLEAALARLEPGLIAPDPVETNGRYWLVKRLPPPPELTHQLPSPVTVDVEYVAREFKAKFWARELSAVEKKAALSVPDATALLTQLHAPWGTLAPDTAEARRQLLHQMDAQLRKRLNEHDYDWYRTVLTEHLETVLLNRRR